MTTYSPKKVRFYIALSPSIPGSLTQATEPVTFTLPAGTKFPSDLADIMKKTGRFFPIGATNIEGVSKPLCEGEGCECSNLSCTSPIGCKNTNCAGFSSSIDTITCNKNTCTRSNDMTYYMTPFYPSEETYLSQYNPKFKFIKFIPSQIITKQHYRDIVYKYVYGKDTTIQETSEPVKKQLFPFPPGWALEPGMTMPPGDFIPYVGTLPPDEIPPPGWDVLPGMIIPPGGTFPPEFLQSMPMTNINEQREEDPMIQNLPAEIEFPQTVVFAITYPSFTDFDTDDKFLQLYEKVMLYNLGFLMIKQDQYLQHNIAVLQQIIRANKLPKTLLNPKKLILNGGGPSSTINSTQSQIGMNTPFPDVVEGYDGEIQLNNLVIPTLTMEDTDNVATDILSTPEPDEYTDEIQKEILSAGIQSVGATNTIPPKHRRKGLSLGAKVGIGLSIGFVLVMIFLWKWRSSSIAKKSLKKSK